MNKYEAWLVAQNAKTPQRAPSSYGGTLSEMAAELSRPLEMRDNAIQAAMITLDISTHINAVVGDHMYTWYTNTASHTWSRRTDNTIQASNPDRNRSEYRQETQARENHSEFREYLGYGQGRGRRRYTFGDE